MKILPHPCNMESFLKHRIQVGLSISTSQWISQVVISILSTISPTASLIKVAIDVSAPKIEKKEIHPLYSCNLDTSHDLFWCLFGH